jgi:uncharacterized protein YqkB
MTVSTEVSREEYTGNGVTTDFDYRFRVFQAADLVVSVADTTETISVLTLNTDYTVTGAGSRTGGKVKLSSPLAFNWRISIERALPVTQETDVRNQGNFFPEVHEDAWDKLTMLIQQVWSYFGLALRKPTWLAKYYDALGNRIANLGNPINPQDAATKSYVDAGDVANSQHADDLFKRTLRVPEDFIPMLPSSKIRSLMLQGYNNIGDPVMIAAQTDTADLALKLASTTGLTLIGGLHFATPEMFGAGDGVTTDTAAWIAALGSDRNIIYAAGDYTLTDNIVIPAGKTVIIDGIVKQESSGNFVWTESNRRSDYYLFKVTSPNVVVKGSGRIENQFEAVYVDTGGDNFTLDGMTISNPNRSKSVGLSLYNANNLTVKNCYIANNGSKGVYVDSSATGITGRYGNGIDFGGVRGMDISGNTLIDNGGNGAWCYGASDLSFVNNRCYANGASGFQFGPHASYDGLTITANIFRLNTADGLDINNTAATVISLKASITGNVSIFNGFYNGDINKPTSDGSGIATLRMVTDYICSNNYSYNCNGVGIYCTSSANAVISDNIVINTVTMSAGIYQGFSSTDVTIHNNKIITRGTCYQEGGATVVTRLGFHDNSLYSSEAQSVSLPSNSRTDITWHNNHHRTPGVINFWFSVSGDHIRYTGGATRGVYFNGNFAKLNNVTVNGSTTGDLVYIDGGTQNHIIGVNANNTGTGRALYANNCTYLSFDSSLIQCANGTAFHAEAGNNIHFISCAITGLTAIDAPIPSIGSAPNIYFTGINQVVGGTNYGVKPRDAQYVQRT